MTATSTTPRRGQHVRVTTNEGGWRGLIGRVTDVSADGSALTVAGSNGRAVFPVYVSTRNVEVVTFDRETGSWMTVQ
ncbi:hypothetical protein ACK8HX_02145 [Oryzobacter sp. R7]|uniref:hypothetical protein n=1 Tax=Oryzobacter faecalis TaxID=3388656 RepID=UPI00398CA430